MDRRRFFTLAGALGVAPLVACEGRDDASSGGAPAVDLEKLRTFVVPAGVEPALVFQPLRQNRTSR